jgi:hypothetical protein
MSFLYRKKKGANLSISAFSKCGGQIKLLTLSKGLALKTLMVLMLIMQKARQSFD